VPADITGSPRHWGAYIQAPGPPDWGLDVRLTILL
jgi:hypothetical protein